MTDYWVDFKTFRISTAPAGTGAWFAARRGLLTASNFGKVLPGSAFVIEKNKPANALMLRGIQLEPSAREWYQASTGRVAVELGFAVPVWDPRIGGAADGFIVDDPRGPGILEIKCPTKMYAPLLQHRTALAEGASFPPHYHQHIWNSHYAQMQGCMKIMAVDWCDYVVYMGSDSADNYLERIYYDPAYWEDTLYPAIDNYFLSKK